MSDNILRILSTDPTFQPTREDADRTVALLCGMVATPTNVTVQFTDNVTFHDPGANWSGVECCACGADAEEWFFDAFDAAAENGFQDLMVVTPCCGKHVSLNDLHYGWPAGFGRFALEVLDPGFSDTTVEQDKELQESLGTRLRKIWVHT